MGVPGRLLSVLALPLAWLFEGGVRTRNALFDRGWRRSLSASIPVLSIGNLTVGGTGKTPVSAWIARELEKSGESPAIISRGYGQDELALHAAWNPSVPVYQAAERHRGIEAAARDGRSVALLDDGFQHRAARRSLDIVLLAVEQPFPPRLLPRGPYREPLTSLARASLVILTRKTATPEEADALEAVLCRSHPLLPVVRVHLRPCGWIDLSGEMVTVPEGDVLALSSVAGPESFERMVGVMVTGNVEGLAFGDHHVYTREDIERLCQVAGERTIVTTEKDAVKLISFRTLLPDVRILRLEVDIEKGEDRLREELTKLVGDSQGSTGSGR